MKDLLSTAGIVVGSVLCGVAIYALIEGALWTALWTSALGGLSYTIAGIAWVAAHEGE